MRRLWWLDMECPDKKPMHVLEVDDDAREPPVRRIGWLASPHGKFTYTHLGPEMSQLVVDCDSIEHAKAVVETAVRLRCDLEVRHE